jgi:N4-gp56 family major capsid protein
MGLWYDSTDNEVVQTWEKELGREVRARDPLFDPYYGFAGKSDTSLIQIKDQLTNGPGARIRTKLRYQLDGRGRAGEEPLKGYGEAYKTSTFDVEVNVLRHYVETSSPMVDQWVPEDTLEEGRDGLADWFATRYAFSAHLHAAGISIVTDAAYTLHNTINALNSSYIIRPNGKTAGNLTTADTFDVDILNNAARQLKLLRPKIRPASTPRGDRYCVFLAPEQVHSLRQSDSVWFATMQNALAGGRIDDNPLLTNALGEWNGFVFFESDWVPPGLNSGATKIKDYTRRAWIGGAQALFLAHGRGRAPQGYGLNRYRWDRETEDFGHVGQIAATTIVGMNRPRYTKPGEASARENGILCIETYADHGMTGSDVYAPWTAISGVQLEA